MKPALIRREPVLNRQQAMTASRLVVHAETAGQAAELLNELADLWPTSRNVFVGLSGCIPDKELLAWQPPENALLEIPATTLASPATQELVVALGNGNVPLCMDGYAAGMSLPPVPAFRFLLADFRTDPSLPNPPGVALAKNVPDINAFAKALNSGYNGAAGWFFLYGRPLLEKLNPAHAQIVRILNLVRKNAPIKEIEMALKQDVAVSYKLLRYINSAGFGLSCEIESFRHAVAILGYDKLNKWLSLLLVTASHDPAAPALMQTSIARGRLMEILGKDLVEPEMLDNLFITGAFSLLGVLLGARVETVLAEMHLPEPITDAILHNQGMYFGLLDLARACEDESSTVLAAKAAALGISIARLNRAQLEALRFADTMQSS